ncbi:DUF2004 domain-containing protein [Lacinutrix mariniflava]|uniref:DUF2004 domain-containing protein n=1 Tax=Lacinutrix mariniflava TaxID=342955 RepID=UPI0006E18CC1|nr:DUF2004 domain-containing protein [Lacinutrix mariniflava]
MEKFKLPYFKEEIDIQNLRDEYETELEYNGKEINIFLNEMLGADKEQLNQIKNTLENLSEFDKQNRSFISNDFKNQNGNTFEYLSYHLDELNVHFKEIIDSKNTKLNNLKKIMNLLKIATISFYSDLVVFYYSLDDEISDQLLVVKLDRQKNRSLDWES